MKSNNTESVNSPITVILNEPVSVKATSKSADSSISLILSQPVSVALPSKSFATPEIMVSAAAIVITIIVAWMQTRIQSSMRDIQSSTRDIQNQKLSLDLFDRRMKIYLAVRNVMDAVFGQSLDQKHIREFYNAYNDANFLFGENLLEYLQEMGNKLVSFQTQSSLIKEYESSRSADPELLAHLREEWMENMKWFTNQHTVRKPEITPPIVKVFKEYLDFSKLKG